MRPVIGSLAILIFTACASQLTVEPSEPTLAPVVEEVIPTPFPEPVPVAPPAQDKFLDITPEGYQSLLNRIQKKGEPEGDNNIQYTYWDKAGNRHAIVAIYKPDNVPQAHPSQISVWVNNRNVRPGTDSYAYIIHDDGSVDYDCYCRNMDGEKIGPDYGEVIKVAIGEVLELANTQP